MRNTQSTPSEPACGRAYTKSVSTKHVSDIFDPTQWDEVQGFSFNDITYHRAKAHGTVRIAFNRPEIRNAFRPATVDELFTALDHARQSSDVGCVLLTGNGPSPKMVAGRFAVVAISAFVAKTDTSTQMAKQQTPSIQVARDVYTFWKCSDSFASCQRS